MALTGKHKKFADEYLIDLNATQAYLRAGYKCKEDVARRNASRLLTNADVQSYIEERQQKLQKKTGMDQEWVLNQYKYLYDENKDKDAQVAKSTLDSVAKHLGMFTDKLQIDGNINYSYEDQLKDLVADD